MQADLSARHTGYHQPEHIRELIQVQVYPFGTRLPYLRIFARNLLIGERQLVNRGSGRQLKPDSNLFLPLLFLIGFVVLKNLIWRMLSVMRIDPSF